MAGTQDIQKLFRRYLDGQCSALEIAFLLDHFKLQGNQSPLREIIEKEFEQLPPKEWEESQEIQDVFNDVQLNLAERIKTDQNREMPLWSRWYRHAGIAAAALIVLGIGLYFFKTITLTPNEVAQNQITNDALPGTNKATLTLGDGSVLNLDNARNGEIANETGILIRKTNDGTVLYETDMDYRENTPVTYNTISTPNAGQYKIVLPDGTRVWLNAGSSLKYPVQFAAKDRKVLLSGEGYFEVSPMKDKPFIVQSRGQTVQVLGTHFNINSYADEIVVKTTLLEGSVKVSETSGYASRLLKPGQQSMISRTGISVAAADIFGAVAWKEGMFRFDHTDIKTLMRQLERWYDIQVDEGSLPDRKFSGEISRDVPLSQVLQMIEVTTNLKFKLEGKRLTMVQ